MPTKPWPSAREGLSSREKEGQTSCARLRGEWPAGKVAVCEARATAGARQPWKGPICSTLHGTLFRTDRDGQSPAAVSWNPARRKRFACPRRRPFEGVLKSGCRSLEFRLQPANLGDSPATDRLKAELQHLEDTLFARPLQLSCLKDGAARPRGRGSGPLGQRTLSLLPIVRKNPDPLRRDEHLPADRDPLRQVLLSGHLGMQPLARLGNRLQLDVRPA